MSRTEGSGALTQPSGSRRTWRWVGLALVVAVVGVGAINYYVTSDDYRTSEHCLEPKAGLPHYDYQFERRAHALLQHYGFLSEGDYVVPLRPLYAEHSLVTGGTRLNEYSVKVWLVGNYVKGDARWDPDWMDELGYALGLDRHGSFLGPIYVYGEIDPETCRAIATHYMIG